MKNEEIIKLYEENRADIKAIREDVTEIKISMAKLQTTWKVTSTIILGMGVVIGFFVELFYKST